MSLYYLLYKMFEYVWHLGYGYRLLSLGCSGSIGAIARLSLQQHHSLVVLVNEDVFDEVLTQLLPFVDLQ